MAKGRHVAGLSFVLMCCLPLLSRADWVQDGGSLNVNTSQIANTPSLAFNGATPYVAWFETDGTNYQVYVKHYNGSSWVQDGGSLNVNTALSAYEPSLAVDGATPYAAWHEFNATVSQIYVKHYNGSGWVQDGGSLNVNTAQNAYLASLAFNGATAYVAWEESDGAGVYTQICVKHYNGSGWVQDGGSLNVNTSQNAYEPCLAFNGSTPYVAWQESDGIKSQIYVKHYNGSGWMQDGGSLNANTAQDAYSPSLAVNGVTPYVAWHEFNGTTGWQIYVKHYNGSGWVQDGGSLNVDTTQVAYNASLAFTGTTPYVAWYEYTGAIARIYVKHYNGSGWVQDGGNLNVNTSQSAYKASLAFTGTTPYVAWYETNGTAEQICVKHWIPPTATPTPTSTPVQNSPTLTQTPSPPGADFFAVDPRLVKVSRGETVRIRFTLAQAAPVRIQAYDLAGRRVGVLAGEQYSAGGHQIIWDGTGVGSGTYLVYFEAEGRRARGKVVIVK